MLNIMNDFNAILSQFNKITLNEMNKVKLLDRLDKKYMFQSDMLPGILDKAMQSYFVLDIEGKRFASYETTYFDTPDYEMYTKHHDGKLNRYKVRFRTYTDSGIHFFEIKFKTNKGRTKKNRLQLQEDSLLIDGDKAALLERKTLYKPESLLPAITVNYNRITLVNKNLTERLTIDFGLAYHNGVANTSLPGLIIAEVKQDRSRVSPFIDIMNEKRIKPESMSKYCLGIALLINKVKHNNFKPKIRYVNQLLSKSA